METYHKRDPKHKRRLQNLYESDRLQFQVFIYKNIFRNESISGYVAIYLPGENILKKKN